jgi:hypothetical protein
MSKYVWYALVAVGAWYLYCKSMGKGSVICGKATTTPIPASTSGASL